MNEKFLKLKILNYSIYLYFWSHDSQRDRPFKYLNFEPNADVHFWLMPHDRMCQLLLDPLLLRTSFMDDL